MKKFYISPEMEIEQFVIENKVLTASDGGNFDAENPTVPAPDDF